jgi:hypothetical protein
MFLALFLSLFFGDLQANFDHFAARDDMHWNDHSICVLYKAEVISEVEYPKSRLFLQNLIQKYPKEFENVSFYMVRSFSPFAGCGIIGIPYEWLIKLEAQVSIAEQWIEWALLHEAGHIHHQHVKVYSYLNIGQVIFSQVMVTAFGTIIGMNFMTKEAIEKQFGKEEYVKYIAIAGLVGVISCIAAQVAYSKYVAEPQADDFSAEKCQSKEALEAGACWLDKVSLDNAMYPSVESRVAKIQKAIEKKFGKKS